MNDYRTLKFLLLLLIIMIHTSCDLKHSNPLDPEGNNKIKVPPMVTGLTATGSGPGVQSKYVDLRWTKNTLNTDGYYIYMGLAYNSQFKRVGEPVFSPPDNLTTITKTIQITNPGFYYFKVSAFKNYGESGTLEGPLSEWALARVDN